MHIMFDTLAVTKKLEEHGMTRLQAEAIVTVIRDTQSEFFTKEDAERLEERLNNKIDRNSIELNNKIDTLELRLTIKIGVLFIVILGVAGTLNKIFNIF